MVIQELLVVPVIAQDSYERLESDATKIAKY